MNENSEHLLELEENEVLCRKGDAGNHLYFVTEGKLMICSRQGRMVTPLGFIEKNEYFGELSFFDSLPRSADVIALEPTKLVKITNEHLQQQMPNWMIIIAKQMSKKIRLMDDAISSHGIKKQNVESVKPLKIEDQRFYFNLLEEK